MLAIGHAASGGIICWQECDGASACRNSDGRAKVDCASPTRLAPRPNLMFSGTRAREESELVRAETASESSFGGSEAGDGAATCRAVNCSTVSSAVFVSMSNS